MEYVLFEIVLSKLMLFNMLLPFLDTYKLNIDATNGFNQMYSNEAMAWIAVTIKNNSRQ